jgi:anti-anti-sigma regulatory factor
MSYEAQWADATATIQLPVEATIRDVAELRTCLLEVLAHAEEVRIDVSRAMHVDTAVVQTLCAAAKSADRLGKSFGIAGPVGPTVQEELGLLGLSWAAPFVTK